SFSLAFYGRPGIAETCLALQDRDGLDVNLLLLCCWLGWSGQGGLGREDLAALEAAIAPWRGEIVERLRTLRRVLNTMPNPVAPALRQDVLRLELAAERETQRLLIAALSPGQGAPGDGFADAECSVTTYLAARGCPPERAAALLGGLRHFR
ncbi:MAG: TIGR02444 family protein, partial [Alphaproteobacteria bacterium]|nr:TIGR02444 family protein [Alphaproteobacteria bacterium]